MGQRSKQPLNVRERHRSMLLVLLHTAMRVSEWHSFRVATITDLIDQGVPLEDVQHWPATRLYDRTKRKVTRNIVEHIRLGR